MNTEEKTLCGVFILQGVGVFWLVDVGSGVGTGLP